MKTDDDFSSYHEEHLEGSYDCVDRIVINGYFGPGQQGGGFRFWWRNLHGSDDGLTQENLQRMAGDFSRRVRAYCRKHTIPVIYCPPKTRKHEIAEKHRPSDPEFQGVFLVLVAKAPALVWEVKHASNGQPHLQRKKPWPYVNHYHFHIIDPQWGHVTIKMSGHPPFGVQIILNGHEWVERQARQQTISQMIKREGNCFVGGSDLQALDRITSVLLHGDAWLKLAEVCDRWVYSSCLCFALRREEQDRSRFRYQYSGYQLEYSRNLLFWRGRMLDEVFQALIDRNRRLFDVPRLKTIFGRKTRPYHLQKGRPPIKVERVVDETEHDLTVFKVHWGRLTLKIYDKGDRILRIEAIAHNVADLRCGKRLEKLQIMLAELQRMTIDFLNTVQAADVNFLDEQVLDTLPQPTQCGNRRLAGVDLQKPRLRAVAEAVVALATNPSGFTARELCRKMPQYWPQSTQHYTCRNAAYDLRKLRGKQLVERIDNTCRYKVPPHGIHVLAGLIILRQKVIRPVLAGLTKRRTGPKSKNVQPVDEHYYNLRDEMKMAFRTLGIERAA